MLALVIFEITLCGLMLYAITVLQDVRDLLNIEVSPFLYEKDSPVFDKLDKDRKRRGKKLAKKALGRKG